GSGSTGAPAYPNRTCVVREVSGGRWTGLSAAVGPAGGVAGAVPRQRPGNRRAPQDRLSAGRRNGAEPRISQPELRLDRDRKNLADQGRSGASKAVESQLGELGTGSRHGHFGSNSYAGSGQHLFDRCGAAGAGTGADVPRKPRDIADPSSQRP